MTLVKTNPNLSRSKRKKIAKLFQKHIPLRTKKDWEEIYEDSKNGDKDGVRELLPTKIGSKLYKRFIHEESQPEIPEKSVKIKKSSKTEQIQKSKLANFANLSFSEFSTNLENICTSVVSSPTENIERLSALIKYLGAYPEETHRSNMTMTSLFDVFSDLTPGYRIRLLEKSENAKIRLKKETRSQQFFDSSFLLLYKKFLNFLITAVTEKVLGIQVPLNILGQLVLRNPNFNFSEIIINFLVRVLTFSEEKRELAKSFLIRLLGDDRLGETTLMVVNAVSTFSKSSESISLEMAQILMHVRIDDSASLHALDELKFTENKKSRNNMSRRERKENREFRILEKEMRHTEISENKTRVAELQAQILEKMFYIFCRVLKNAQLEGPILSATLSGLSKYAKHVNIELVNDLLIIFKRMLSELDLTDSDRMHVVKTAFSITAGGDVTLCVEQNTFFRQLNESILMVGGGPDQDIISLIECLQVVIATCLGQVNSDNIEDILCRLTAICLHAQPPVVLAYFALARRLILSGGRKMSAGLLGGEDSVFSFTPVCGDSSDLDGVNWQLSLLKRHYHKSVRDCVQGMMAMASGKIDALNFLEKDLSGKELIESLIDCKSLTLNCEKPMNLGRKKWTGFLFSEFEHYYDDLCKNSFI